MIIQQSFSQQQIQRAPLVRYQKDPDGQQQNQAHIGPLQPVYQDKQFQEGKLSQSFLNQHQFLSNGQFQYRGENKNQNALFQQKFHPCCQEYSLTPFKVSHINNQNYQQQISTIPQPMAHHTQQIITQQIFHPTKNFFDGSQLQNQQTQIQKNLSSFNNQQLNGIMHSQYTNSNDHKISINCLRKCSQWNMTIKVNNKKLIRVPYSGIALKQNGSIEVGAASFCQDILDVLIEMENSNTHTNLPTQLHQDIRDKLHLKQYNSFVHKSQQVPLDLPLENSEIGFNNKLVDLLKDKVSESMFCVEFDVTKFQLFDNKTGTPNQDNCSFRLMNQSLVESNLHFFVNGYCHGQKILAQDLHFQLQGKKVVKSIQQRIIDYKQYINDLIVSQQQGLNTQLQQRYFLEKINYQPNIKTSIGFLRQANLQGQGPFLRRPDSLHVKMLNITKSIGIEVQYQNLPNFENFLTNFNQIVLQEGVIKKFFFCFDLPISYFTKNKYALQQQQMLLQSQSQFMYERQVLSPITNMKTESEGDKNNYFHLENHPQVSQGVNLLNEFKKIKEDKNDEQILNKEEIQEKSQNIDRNLRENLMDFNILSPSFNKIGKNSDPKSALNTKQYLPIQAYNKVFLSPIQHKIEKLVQESDSNLNRFLLQVTPHLQDDQTLGHFFEYFQQVSCIGLKIAFQVENEEFISTFIPTLSSLKVQYYQPINIQNIQNQSHQFKEVSVQNAGENYIVNMNETIIQHQQQQLIDFSDTETTSEYDNSNYMYTYNNKPNFQKSTLYYNENNPPYLRVTLSETLEQIFSGKNSSISQINVNEDLIKESSWFVILWSQLKLIPVNKKSQPLQQIPQNPQFLVFYKFGQTQDNVEIIGIIPYKQESSLFWSTPIYDNKNKNNNQHLLDINEKRYLDLQDKAMQFVEKEKIENHDYNFFVHQISTFCHY